MVRMKEGRRGLNTGKLKEVSKSCSHGVFHFSSILMVKEHA